ncbi:MAG: hypothetical protein KF858_06190 [Candidatus Sumerlaeia bacterium]|nr:hypothetical protein [Candidatus Sumerlaeia bacterium]
MKATHTWGPVAVILVGLAACHETRSSSGAGVATVSDPDLSLAIKLMEQANQSIADQHPSELVFLDIGSATKSLRSLSRTRFNASVATLEGAPDLLAVVLLDQILVVDPLAPENLRMLNQHLRPEEIETDWVRVIYTAEKARLEGGNCDRDAAERTLETAARDLLRNSNSIYGNQSGRALHHILRAWLAIHPEWGGAAEFQSWLGGMGLPVPAEFIRYLRLLEQEEFPLWEFDPPLDVREYRN